MNQQNELYTLQSNYKQKQRRKLLIFLSAFLAFLVLIYFVLAEIFPKVAIRFISEEQEIAIGDKFYQSLMAEKKINSMATMQLQSFADHLELSNKYPIKITVVEEDEVNAYALPGGHIIVNTGILEKLSSADALVALLSHETIHINRRHSLQNILSGMGTGILISLVTHGGGGLPQLILGNANLLRELSYSRKLEKEADEQGMWLMERNGVSPGGMLQLMETLAHVDEDSNIPSISFLSTHPLTEDRMEAAKKFIAAHPLGNALKDESLVGIWLSLKKNINDK